MGQFWEIDNSAGEQEHEQRIAELEATCEKQGKRITEAEAEAKEYRDTISWNTTCKNCAKILTNCYAETCAKEEAEAERDKLRKALRGLLESVKSMMEYLDKDFDIPEAHYKTITQAEAALGQGRRVR